ncbi:MAG: hypothetical protein R3F36_14295 [Candidatus Competibacteraceae bacterium]
MPRADYPGKADLAAAFEAGWLRDQAFPVTSWQPSIRASIGRERSSIAAALQWPGCLLVIDDCAWLRRSACVESGDHRYGGRDQLAKLRAGSRRLDRS